MASLLLRTALLLFLFFTLAPNPATSELVLEDGFTVLTVLDFNKPRLSTVQLFSVLPRTRSQDLLILDSSKSTFYSLSIPVSQDNEINLFSGKGVSGFADGDRTVAMFDRPRSFAIDSMDNVYVADRHNGAIRKISRSGVTTTIAGGYSENTGHNDGPAQNASFSNDFELIYVPKICALLISDRGNRLVRQMNLRPEDCAHESQSGLGTASISVIVVLCIFFGSVLGFLARPFFGSHEVSCNRRVNKTWKPCRTNLGRLLLITCSDIKSAVASTTLYVLMVKLVVLSFYYMSIIFRNVRLEKPVLCREPIPLLDSDTARPVSLLDSDATSNHGIEKSQYFVDQLKDMISFEGSLGVLEVNRSSKQEYEMEDASESNLDKIEDMIRANLSDFADQNNQQCQLGLSRASSCGLVKRKP